MLKNRVFIILTIGLATVAGIWLGARLNYPKRPLVMHSQEINEQKLRQIIDLIDYEYVDDVNTDSLLDVTIEELLHKLDPHSAYIAASDVQRSSENLQGSFEGIGIEFTVVKDSLTVLRVIEKGPSEKAGLKAGDRILIVEKDTIAGVSMKNSQYVSLLKGPAGSKVNLDVWRPTEKNTLNYTITRGTIPLPSVDIAFMINDELGIIKVNRFSETTEREFDEALQKLKKEGASKIILDLRDNPGGLLYSANKMADHFLEKDQLIVYTKNRQDKREDSKATEKGLFKTGDVYVLINENSASASEIIAGALQDNDRATIVGRRSYGKGLVQEEIRLKDGSRIRLTTSRYYTPTGRSIQRPYEEDYDHYRQEAYNRYYNGELFNEDSIKVNEELKFETPKGKIVYGGGGIVPDVFVPLDTSYIGLFHYFSIGELDRFAFHYIDKNRTTFNTVNFEEFKQDFEVTDEIIDEFFFWLALTKAQKQKSLTFKMELQKRLRGLIGRNLYGSKAFHQLNLELDKDIQKAITISLKEEGFQ